MSRSDEIEREHALLMEALGEVLMANDERAQEAAEHRARAILSVVRGRRLRFGYTRANEVAA